MHKLPLVGALLTSAALAGPVLPRFLYNFPDNRLETLPKGKLPFLTVMDAQKLKAAQQNDSSCCRDARAYPKFEWSVPIGTEVASRAVGRDLRAARDVVPEELRPHLPASPPHDDLHLDTYGPFPLIPKSDYCDDVSLDPTVMFLPGTCDYAFGVKVLCIEGKTASLNPLAPRPLWFNDAEARRRVQDAVTP